jgi:adenosylcobinamide-phosphate synthase
VVLYFALRFSYFGQHAEKIGANLKDQNIPPARQLLAEWENTETDHYTANQIASVCIETTLKRAHQGMFGPIFWFALLGPAGALLYRLSYQIAKQWRRDNPDDDFAFVAHKILAILDYIPTRLTAMSFSLMGNFEEAVYYWRAQVAAGRNHARHLLIASAEGALGIRLSDQEFSTVGNDRPVLGLGERFEPLYLQSAVSLIWRALVLWLAVIGLMNIQSGVMIVFN